MIIGVYVDTTDWGANFWDDPDTFGDDNFCYVNIPTDIVMKWFYDCIMKWCFQTISSMS